MNGGNSRWCMLNSVTPVEQCRQEIGVTSISILLVRLRAKLGRDELCNRTGITYGVIKNYIAEVSEPRWHRGADIYNLAVEEFGELR